MSAIDRAVDAVPLIVGVLTKCFEQTLPDTLACPTVEPVEHGLPGAKVAGKISPRRACTPPPQDRFHEVAIVTPRTPGAFPHAQRCFDPLPLPLIQVQAHHRGHPWSTLAAQWKARSSECPTKVGSPCAPSWARRARARPAPQTSASQTNGPDDYSRTVGHGHVYGHARAVPIQGHALVSLSLGLRPRPRVRFASA